MPGEVAQQLKPSRSDEIIPLPQQIAIGQQIRQHFEASAPKRPLKPARSECLDEETSCQTDQLDLEIPEYRKLKELAACSEHILVGSGGNSSDEFVETEYYNDLNSVDKTQHHTTGTGFIRIDMNGMINLNLPSSGPVRTRSNCNPATNDWVPSPEVVFPSSDKPRRSDP